MEENRNENERQAYGNQNQTYGDRQTYGDQQSYGGQPGYGNPSGYNNPPVYYNNGSFVRPEQQHGPVTDVFCYILLVIMPLRQILSIVTTSSMFRSMDFSYDSIMNGTYMNGLLNGSYMLLTILSYLLMAAFIVFVVLDIVKIYKQHYKITGLILFAIFLNPGYYIWRAHILHRKKTVPVIYTVLYSLLVLGSMVYTFMETFRMIMGMFYYY